MATSKCKLEIPNQLPESSLSRVQFKSWRDAMMIYLKQNDDFTPFFPGGEYENWEAGDENSDRISALHADDGRDKSAAEQQKLLLKRRKDLETMLNIIGRKVDQYDFDDVVNTSTSLSSIWTSIELTYDIGRKGSHFLDLQNIKFESGEAPIKFYKRVYHHFMDNMFKRGDTLSYKNTTLEEDEKLSPTLLNFILFYTIEKIDLRLMSKIKDKWGHILNKEKCLHDLKDIILKAIPDLLSKMEKKEADLSAFGSYRNLRPQRGSLQKRADYQDRNPPRRQENRKFCRLCQASRCSKRIYTSHNMSDCTRWSKKDIEDMRVMILDMNIDPTEYPDSDCEGEQD